MARRKQGKRVLGPYLFRGRQWQLVIVDAEGKRDPVYFETEKEALAMRRAIQKEIGEVEEKTVSEAIDAYELYLRDEKGNKPNSIDMTVRRVRSFFTEPNLLLARLDKKRAAACYEALTKRVAVDTHRNMLAEARSFLKWCTVKKGWVAANSLDGVEGIGRRNHGKPQLRIDEARRWQAKAEELIKSGDEGALAADMALLMALRATEITKRRVRDLDDGGALLWIEGAKTEKSNGAVVVPELLRPHLLQLVRGRSPDAVIFEASGGGVHWRDWIRENVQRICRLAKVPEVCAHSMRGLHATLAAERGETVRAVQEALRHEDARTTVQSYVAPSALRNATQKRAVLKVLTGGQAA